MMEEHQGDATLLADLSEHELRAVLGSEGRGWPRTSTDLVTAFSKVMFIVFPSIIYEVR
jgi:hypothetical protein